MCFVFIELDVATKQILLNYVQKLISESKLSFSLLI
jgi:hypothetical protein